MERSGRPWFLDEITGFPLPLRPIADAPTVYNKDGTEYHSDPDHHHFFFPKRVFLEHSGDTGGTLVRVSRTQRVRRYYHMKAHKELQPPDISLDSETSFYLATLALSNYVPSQAIDLRGSSPKQVELGAAEYADLRASTFKGYKGGTQENLDVAVGEFLLKTMLINNSEVIDDNFKDEFLSESRMQRKYDLANRVAKLLTYHAVEPLNDVVAERRKAGEIPEGQPSPFKVVTRALRPVERHNVLEDMLRAA